jgi:hypothetical protein
LEVGPVLELETPERDHDTDLAEQSDLERVTVVVPVRDVSLPELLRHIEAGRVVLIVPTPQPCE